MYSPNDMVYKLKRMGTLLERDTLHFSPSPMSLTSLFKDTLSSHFTWVGFMNEDWRQLFAICSAGHSHPLVDQLLLLSCCWIVLEAFQFCFQEQWSTAVKQTSNIYTRFSNLCSLKYGVIWIVFSVNTGEHWNPYFPTYLFTLSVKETNGTYSKCMDALMRVHTYLLPRI